MALPKTHKFFISKAEAEKEEFEAQTEADATLEKNTQTASSKHSELGVQVENYERKKRSQKKVNQSIVINDMQKKSMMRRNGFSVRRQ